MVSERDDGVLSLPNRLLLGEGDEIGNHGRKKHLFFVYFGWETREQVVLQALHGMLSYICGGEGEEMTGASIGRVSSRKKLARDGGGRNHGAMHMSRGRSATGKLDTKKM